MTEPGPPVEAPMQAAAPTVHWQAPAEATGPAPGVEFAGHGARLLAYIIDSLIVIAIFALLFIVGAAALSTSFSSWAATVEGEASIIRSGIWVVPLILFVLGTIVVLLYFPFFWARGGQTPGMRPFGLRVVRDQDGGRIGWGTALLRLLGMYVASAVFYLGFVWIFVDKRRRGFHDLIAGTVVVQRS